MKPPPPAACADSLVCRSVACGRRSAHRAPPSTWSVEQAGELFAFLVGGAVALFFRETFGLDARGLGGDAFLGLALQARFLFDLALLFALGALGGNLGALGIALRLGLVQRRELRARLLQHRVARAFAGIAHAVAKICSGSEPFMVGRSSFSRSVWRASSPKRPLARKIIAAAVRARPCATFPHRGRPLRSNGIVHHKSAPPPPSQMHFEGPPRENLGSTSAFRGFPDPGRPACRTPVQQIEAVTRCSSDSGTWARSPGAFWRSTCGTRKKPTTLV